MDIQSLLAHIKHQDEQIQKLKAEIASLTLEKRGTAYYCEPRDPSESCANAEPLCYEREMEDCAEVTCNVCSRHYVIVDHGCDGFQLRQKTTKV